MLELLTREDIVYSALSFQKGIGYLIKICKFQIITGIIEGTNIIKIYSHRDDASTQIMHLNEII